MMYGMQATDFSVFYDQSCWTFVLQPTLVFFFLNSYTKWNPTFNTLRETHL